MNKPKNIKLVIESFYNPELKLVMGDENYAALKEKNRHSKLPYDFGDYYVTDKAVYYKHDNRKSYHKVANLAIHPLIVTLIARLHVITDKLTDLDLDLLKALNDYIEPDYVKTEAQFIQTLKDFSRFDSPSYLVATDDIFHYVVKYSDDYASYINYTKLQNISAEQLLYNGLSSAAEYLYFHVTPEIINRYICVMR